MQFFCAAVRMLAMKQSIANVPSEQAVKLVVLGPGFVEHCWLGLFFGIPALMAMKNIVNWENGFAVGDANTKIVP